MKLIQRASRANNVIVSTLPTGLKFNLQAKDLSDGAVSTWDTFFNSTASNTKPTCNSGGDIGGGKYVSFNGTSTYLYNQTILNNTNGLTIGFLVRFKGSVRAWERLMQGTLVASPSVDFFAINRNSNNPYLTFHIVSGQGNDYATPVDNFSQDVWYVWTYRFTNSGTNTRISRVTAGTETILLNSNNTGTSMGTFGNATYCLGANNFGNAATNVVPQSGNYVSCDIGGFMLYERALTDEELTNLRNYLSSGLCC